MKHLILLCLCILGSQLNAQTTQPAEKQGNEMKSGNEMIENRLRPTPKMSKNTDGEAMTKDTPNKVENVESLLSEKELMAKYGLAISDKNVLGGLTSEDKVPNIKGIDQNGNKIDLYDMLKEGEVVVFFYRGIWCGICNRQLAEMENQLSKITDKGAKVIAITSESNEFVTKTSEKHNLSFSVISDEDGKIMKDYKVLYEVSDDYQKKVANYTKSDLQTYNNSDEAFLPIPATYIVGKDGKLSYIQYSMDYAKRATVDEIAKYLK